jgi:hypothetical protein
MLLKMSENKLPNDIFKYTRSLNSDLSHNLENITNFIYIRNKMEITDEEKQFARDICKSKLEPEQKRDILKWFESMNLKEIKQMLETISPGIYKQLIEAEYNKEQMLITNVQDDVTMQLTDEMPVTFEYNNQNLESGMPTTSYENIPDRVSLTFLASRLKNISMTDVEKDDAAKDFYNKYSKSQDVEELKKVQNIFKEQSINMDLDMLKELAAVINIETTKETEIVKDRMLELISHGASIMPYVALNSEYSQKINDFINSFDEDSSHDSKQTSLEERFE